MTAEPTPHPAIVHLFATRQDRTRPPAPLNPTATAAPAGDDDTLVITDPVKFVDGVYRRALNDLQALPHGQRNDGLNTVAFSLGRLVASHLLDLNTTEKFLEDACDIWPDRDPRNVTGTIRSGLRAGMSNPRQWVQGERAASALAAPFMPAAAPLTPFNTDTGETIAPERTSWWPRDLEPILAGDSSAGEPPPTFLQRSDGKHLMYAGKVNALIGESESGKTWVALLAAAQALGQNTRVLYLDFEDTAPGIVARLRSMGVKDKHMQALSYISPDEALHALAERDLAEFMADHAPQLVIVDGVNAAMTLLGLDLSDNKDATAFSLKVLRPLKRTGACVITVDHVTKSKDNRGNYAIGAQAKRADIDGCSISVEVIDPFGRGNSGRLKLTVAKDRPGHVRAVAVGARNAGEARLISDAETGTVDVTVEAPALADPTVPFRPTVLMQRVSEYLEREGATKRTSIKLAVQGENTAVLDALDILVEDGYVRIGSSKEYVSALAYRADADMRSKTSVRPFASVERPADVPENVRPSPLPIGGRRTDPSVSVNKHVGVDKHTGEIIEGEA